jgi:hypothetical protein
MTRIARLRHEFVQYIPEVLSEGVLYISISFATTAHKCCCGCGNEVVTPIAPTDWRLCFDGETISLWPSIGNWSFACQSHYWIAQGRVRWAPRWSQEQIAAGRERDRNAKERYFTRTATDDYLITTGVPTPRCFLSELKLTVRRWFRRSKG